MDYFEKQRKSRSQTAILIVFMLCAVAGVVFAADMVVSLSAWWFFEVERLPLAVHLWLVGLNIFLIIAFALRRFHTLREGGEAVARLVKARKVRRDTQNPAERRLLNVVEEMSIASGVAVPSVWTLDMEDGINALAAGYSPNQAAVVVTRGALEKLTRDELQGVIGHEFSHILNGDMRLNVILVGIIAGIVVVGEAGLLFIRLGAEEADWGAFPFLIFGVLLGAVGYIGVFCGRLIKAAVSRQREFLADVSSALFTRNPDGLAGALKKISEQEKQTIKNAFAGELSHMFFSQAVAMKMFRNMLATHPPIEERLANLKSRGGETAPPGDSLDGGSVAERVGVVRPEHLDMASALLGSIPDVVKKALETADGACAVVYAYLLAREPKNRAMQDKLLAGSPAALDKVNRLAEALNALGVVFRLPIIELAIPALGGMSPQETERFLSMVDSLVEADGEVTMSEFVIRSVLKRHLSPRANRRENVQYKNLTAVKNSVLTVLSFLAEAGSKDQKARNTAFGRGVALLGWKDQAQPSIKHSRSDEMTKALEQLRRLDPMGKREIIAVCGRMAQADKRLTLEEYELMRTLGMALDCPMPPEVDWRLIERGRSDGKQE